ncbi:MULTISPECIES: hypothetical protein [Streptomyces]|uniref:hypothetical protein n=1 Tax=Streptomyces TaxID=1883 RepID=UPI0016771E36|nr:MULTISPECIES: hypothetical protein [Streptomyces]MBD3576413.1 hypothetical protein [Streptomyces sp. KD18]GGS88094.1 hypothetical protein GCM10010286_11040 [Streptomyces toxytricini]
MRTAFALRTSLVTAALAGALLWPAASGVYTAVAAQGPHAAAEYGGGAASDGADRYAGEPVYIGEGLVAVLRNGAEGPEAWIRAVGTRWKPGDTYMVRVLALLDRSHPGDTVNGLGLRLAKADTDAPVLVVTQDGATASYPLPAKGAAVEPAPAPAAARPPAPAQEAPAVQARTAAAPAALVTTAAHGAAAYEPAAAAEDGDDTVTLAAGAGLVAITGAMAAARLLRARRGGRA